MHPSAASGTSVEVVPGPAQLKLRKRAAILQFTRSGLRIEADCSRDGPWADGGLHFGHSSM
eukprot:15437096-Alexandrium_andersonii.AAC.1